MDINLKKLRSYCNRSINSFFREFNVDRSQDYIYVDNGSNVLGVAHLDTVLYTDNFSFIYLAGIPTIFNTCLDDRLGVYTLLFHLPVNYGVKVDWLLTTDEESMDSTAALFETSKKYNWMFSLDRREDDCVLYDYEDDKISSILESYKWKIGIGSYSDICDLIHLGITGINFGIGYEDNHTKLSRFEIRTYQHDLSRFLKFYQDYKDISLPFSYNPSKIGKWTYIDEYPTRITKHDGWIYKGTKSGSYPKIKCDSCGELDSTTMYTALYKMNLCDTCYGTFALQPFKDESPKKDL